MVFASVQSIVNSLETFTEQFFVLVIDECHRVPQDERTRTINAFKEQKIKYLVNVSVLTTGIDAPHVDLIAILRPMAFISLYQ